MELFLSRTLRWAMVFALCSIVERIIVFFMIGDNQFSASVFSILLGFPVFLLFGFLLAALVISARGIVYRILTEILVLGVLVADSAAFHYEAVFQRLPTRGVFFYFKDLEELGPSLVNNTEPWVFVFEILAIFLILLYTRKTIFQSRLPRFVVRTAVSVGVIGITLVAALGMRFFSFDSPRRHRSPLMWIAESYWEEQIHLQDESIGPQAVLWFQQAAGHQKPFASALQQCPLCGLEERGVDEEAVQRSVILVIMESVGTKELLGSYQGQPVMPKLKEFSQRHLFLENLKAAGTKSGSAMPALFCGVLPQTAAHLLHRVPLPTFEGFPQVLRRRGYRTSYFHGADLSWEHQRSFLRMVGIDEIFERDPNRDIPSYGWGYADHETLGRMVAWIQHMREDSPERPFFSALFTLSSHDPYDLPPDWQSRFDRVDAKSLQYESLAYLDAQLDIFLRWYEEEEMPRGTVLALVGDHTPHLMNTLTTTKGRIFRFDVPLIVAGTSSAITDADPSYGSRRGAHHDIPATIMQAIGVPTTPCDQGVSLLSSNETWPAQRIVYAVGGEDLEEVQLWSGTEHILVDRMYRGTIRLDEELEVSHRIRRFMEILFPLNRFLIRENAYAPPLVLNATERVVLPRVEAPIFVSHRGYSENEDAPVPENSIESIRAAFDKGFECTEVDVQLTRDRIPVLHHDAVFVDVEGRRRKISGLSYSQIRKVVDDGLLSSLEEVLATFPDRCFVVETKPQEGYENKVALAEAVAVLARSEAGRRRIIVDSFSLVQVSATEPNCDCEVAWDLPYRRPVTPALLNAALLADVDWIFLEQQVVTPDVIAEAHRVGLKIMIYTVNEADVLDRLHPELPDGVITDRSGL